MSNQQCPPIPRVLIGRLAGLSYGELAVALSASDMPTRRRGRVSVEQIAEWACQGVARLGESRVRELAEHARQITGRLFARNGLTSAERAGLERQDRRIWRSARRRQRSYDLAWSLQFRTDQAATRDLMERLAAAGRRNASLSADRDVLARRGGCES